MKLDHFIAPYTKINSKWIKDLNVRRETVKLLEKNIGRTLSDINHSKILYDPPPRIMEIKTKINKWNPIKFKSFCTIKEIISESESHSVMFNSLQPHGLQHARLPCPSPTPRACSKSFPSHQ